MLQQRPLLLSHVRSESRSNSHFSLLLDVQYMGTKRAQKGLVRIQHPTGHRGKEPRVAMVQGGVESGGQGGGDEVNLYKEYV